MKKSFAGLLIIALTVNAALAQRTEKVDTAFISKIKKEGLQNSQVMDILSMLTDVNGPRLTNSAGYKKAADYAKATMETWGLQNVAFDVWSEDFGRGWNLKKFSLQNMGPVYYPVIAYPKAWSPGVKGTIAADAVYLDVKTEADLTKYAGKLKGKIVLFSAPVNVKPGFKADASRFSDSTLLQMSNAGITEPFNPNRNPNQNRQAQQLTFLKWELCQKEGVVAVLEASPGTRLEDGTVLVGAATVPYAADIPNDKRVRAQSPLVPKLLPQVIVADEHYNRMIRQIQKGLPVKLELTFDAEFTPSAPAFNIIAEIPGTDLKDEVVMIGAHFDSWHAGTGATDNAAGSSVMMEAMRILKTLGASPRRTIRIGLWAGEEQGLIGSRSYVTRTFGTRLDKSAPWDSIQLKPAAEKFSAYFNMDNGTGKFRGVYMQGNESVRPIFRAWLKPFEKMGASTLSLRNTGATDHVSFDNIGLPGFQLIQDPIEYSSRTHHTSMDLYDKAVDADLRHNAVMIASFAWLAATRDGVLPRKQATPSARAED